MKSGKSGTPPASPAAVPPPANNPMAALLNPSPEQEYKSAMIAQLLMGGGQMLGNKIDTSEANARTDKARQAFKKKQAEELAGWTPVVTKSGE